MVTLETVKKAVTLSSERSKLQKNNYEKHLRVAAQPKKVCYSTIPEIDHILHRLLCKFPSGKLIVCLAFNPFSLPERSGIALPIPNFNLEL